MDTQLDLNSLLQKIFDDHTLISAVLSGPKNKEAPQKITVKPVTIQGQIQYQASLQIEDKVIHQNYHSQQCCEYLKKLNYKQILLFTDQSDYQILISKKGKATILSKPPSKVKSSLEHNRKKNYLIEQDAPFLVELGISRQTG